ncbi:MAG: transcriptional regulator [Bacteroidetes bacterium HGW-Bacteroidetes-15]|nr:MAG: transcriptional regulator [Bacteroidetes bacterium HGW-Bacteroidetes-15]
MLRSIAKRHQLIINKLNEQGFVNVNELSEELGVSLVTIRKDLKILESRNLLHRTHGSASISDPFIIDRNIHDKEKIKVEEKQRIAKAAARLIEPNDSIILGSGSTILELARQIKAIQPLTVVTASLNLSQVLNLNPDIEVHQLGGVIRKSSNSAVGPFAEKMIAGYSCKKFFLGVDGIDPEFGLTTTNSLEASLNQQMISSSQEIIVLADSSKFGQRGFGKICDFSQIDIIITDMGVNDSIVKKIEMNGVEVIKV